MENLYARSIHAEAYVYAVMSFLETQHLTEEATTDTFKAYQEMAEKINADLGYSPGKLGPELRDLNVTLTKLVKELGVEYRSAVEAEIRRVSPNVMDDE
jgi:hypothetical protein